MSHDQRIPIDAVIFDYGEVIAVPDAEDWARLENTANVSGPAFSDAYWRYRLDYDRGLSPNDYWTQVATNAGTRFSEEQIHQLNRIDARHWMHISQPVLDWIVRLKQAGKKLGLISNMPSGLATIFRKELAWFEHFDSIVLSCDLKVCKPDSEIYIKSLEDLAISPARALFIDDKDYNVEGARALGMHGITFESLQGIQPLLTRYELPA